uniref:Uncharacterized protein n=1 Tax=Arundo donax TaxID=35708 RepID=A0A0A9I396_ARUDO
MTMGTTMTMAIALTILTANPPHFPLPPRSMQM